MGHIVVLEDDASMHPLLESLITKSLGDLDLKIEVIETEADFRMKWLPSVQNTKKQRPDIFVIDVMLRWTDPSPNQPPRPPDVIEGGFMRAGLRCLNLIRQRPSLFNTPVIFLTTLTKKNLDDLGANLEAVEILHKGDINRLPGQIRAALAASRR